MTRQAKQPFKFLVGYTELTILPLKTLYTVTLNSRQSLIKRVLVNNFETKYELKNYLDQIVPPHEGYADSETVRTFYRAAQEASDEGELSITIAEPVADEQAQSVLALTDQQHMPVTLRVYYELRDPSGGAVFVLPDKTAYPTRFAHMYTCNQPSGARTWMPCVDSSGERCAWEIELLVPKHCTAVAPGQLQDQLGVSDESMRSFVYKTAKHEKYSAGSIVLSVGVYETVNDAQWPYITHYCLPNRQRALSHVTSYLPQIIAFYEHYLGNKYPYSSYKQVFVEDAYSSVLSGASLSVLSTHLLHDDKVIDQTFETRRLLALSLAQQWFSHFIAVKSWSDQWLVFGLAGYMSYLFVLKVFGYNEFRYRLVRDVEYITAHAHINQPLYNTNYTSAAELYSKLVFVKSTVTMYLLEKRLGTEGFQKLLSGLVIKNAEGDPPDTTVSTSKFLKLAKKLTGLEMKMFADKWIYGKGSPHLICGFWFNRMKNQTEIAIKQDLHKCEKVTGNITIRIHETDEIDEQQVALEDEVHEVDFICHSKSRRNKRPVPRRAAAPTTTAAVGTPVPSESQSVPPPEESAVTMMDLEPAANSSNMAKNAWKHDIPISWIRIDPELHWIRQLSFKQPEFMWINQLENDRDVLAQHEAIQGLAAHPSQNAISALNDVLVNKEMFYRIRMEAAHCMAALTSKETNWLGLDLLIKHFKAAYYYDNLNQLRPNDFSNFSAYFLQRAIAEAVSQVKDEHGRTPSDVIDFLLDLLRNNDNSRNSYSDNYYVASILRALGNTTSTEQQAQERIVKQIERYLDLEKMVPCYHNSITVACLQALMTIYSRQGSAPNLGLFEQYAKYGNFQEVRAIAFEALIRLGVTPNPRSEQASGVLQHVIDCIVRDKSPWLRYRALTALLSALDDTVLDLPELRQQVFDCLNSVTLAYDERVRTAMIDLYVRFGGDKFASFRLEPRPKLPYRPLPKKETDKNKKQKKKRKKEDEDVKPPVKPAPAKIKTQPPVTPKSAGVRTNPVTPSVKTPVTPSVKTPVTPAVKPSPPPSAPVTPSPSGGSLRVSIPVTPRTPTPAVAKVTPTTPNPNSTLAPSPTVPQRSPSPTPVAAPVETKPAPRTPLPPTTPPPPRTPTQQTPTQQTTTQQTPTQQTPTQQTPTPMMVDLAELTIKLPRALVKATLAELARPTFVAPPTTPLPRVPTLPPTQPSPNPMLTLPKITIKTDPNKSMTPSQPVNPNPVLQSHAPSVVAPAGGGLKLRVSVGKPQQTSPTSLKLVVNKDANK